MKNILNRRLGTGEHGVGLGKKEYLVEELGIGTVELMKTIKRAIDPLGLFNPGKARILLLFMLRGEADRLSEQLYPDTSSISTDKHAAN